MNTLKQYLYDSPLGQLHLVATPSTLRAVLWPTDAETDRVTFANGGIGEIEAIENVSELSDHKVLSETVNQLDQYFAGQRRTFDLPLEPQGTEFQVQVWYSLAEIGYGETATYSQQAKAIDNEAAVRAVGAANGKNPLSIVLPCHRVVGADGKLTGFAGGLEAKAWLLEHETKFA